jgi:hypothetical protein
MHDIVSSMPDSGGPYVMIAALCESVIIGADGRVSVINVIEQVSTAQRGPDVPDEMPPFVFPVPFVLDLVSGAAQGRFAVRFQPVDPAGLALDPQEHPVRFGEGTGCRVRGTLPLELSKEGRYWIEIYLVRGRGDEQSDQLLTKLPLNVQYQPQKTGSGG